MDFQRIKKELARVFDDNLRTKQWQNVVDYIIIGLIVISTIEVFLSTYENIVEKYGHILKFIDWFTTIFFTIEVTLRIWTADLQDARFKGFKGRLRYCFTFYGLIDILSTYSFYLHFFMPMPYAALKILRVFRLLRIFRYMKSFKILGDAISSKKHELTVSLAFLTILTVILSFFLYFAEHAAQPELCENGWKTLVWSFAKYLGDPGKIADYPLVTAWGNVLAIIVGVLGIAIFAVPAGLISSGFTEVMEAERDAKALKDNAESINEFMLLKSIKREGIFWPAKNVSLGNLKLDMGLTEDEIVKSVAASKRLRIKNLSDAISEGPKTDMLVVNQFVVNTEYGCHIDRNSSVTIVNPIGKADNGLSFFDWHIAQLGGFNYVANEFYSRQNGLDKEKRFNFYTVVEETKNNSVFQQFIDAITSDRSENDWIIVIAGEQVVKNITDFHFEFGGGKGETSFDFEECITHDKKTLKRLFDDFSNTLSEKAQLTTDAHQVQPKLNKDNIARYIKTRTNANVLLITVSYKLMAFKKEVHSAIYNIADVLNRNLETKKTKGLHTEEYNVRPSESNYWRELYGLPKMEEDK